MTIAAELEERRRAALTVCASVPRPQARELLDMLGLIPLDPPQHNGSPYFDTGHDGGRRAVARGSRSRTGRAPRHQYGDTL